MSAIERVKENFMKIKKSKSAGAKRKEKPQPRNKRSDRRREESAERERRAVADMGDRVHGSEDKPLASLRMKALSHAARMPSPAREITSPPTPGASNWTQLGPMAIPNGQTYGGARVLVAGRVTAIMVDPTDSNTLYVGSANAGVWKSTDDGANWTSKSDFEASVAIGALAMDPSNHLRIYAGTGEGNLTYYKTFLGLVQDSYYGSGLLRSTDGGNTWMRLGASEFTGHSFFRIAINPNDPNTIFAATSNGLFLSKDGGGTWALLTNGLPAISATIMGVSDVVIDPSTPAVVYAAFWGDGIYKTTSGNAANPTWTR